MTPESEVRSDNRLLRGQETRRVLMRAAEKLIAERGLGNVSIREIVTEAQQNNASALQYHFGNLQGLISAIHAERAEQTRAKRAELLEALLTKTPKPDLRQICSLMIQPAFELAHTQPAFCMYIKAFGDQLVLIETSAVSTVISKGAGGASGIEVGKLLRQALPHLSDAAFRQRLDFAIRLCASAMYAQARSKNAFRGEQATFFIEGLIDALVGLMTAQESKPAAKR